MTEYIPLGLLIFILSTVYVVKGQLGKKVCDKTCGDRRKEINGNLRIAVNKLDYYRDIQSEMKTQIAVVVNNVKHINEKQDVIIDHLKKNNGGII